MTKSKDTKKLIRKICAKIRSNKPLMTCKEEYDNLIRAEAYEEVIELIEYYFGDDE